MQSGIVPPTSPYSGGTVGQVVRSRHPGFAEGDYIFGGMHWQEYEAVDGDFALRLDPAELPLEADLAAVGRSAFTGWVGYRSLLRAGTLTYQTTIYDRIEQAPQALADCLSGRNAGSKLIVKVGEPAPYPLNETSTSCPP